MNWNKSFHKASFDDSSWIRIQIQERSVPMGTTTQSTARQRIS
jgi:hypothetical protein